MSPSLHHECTRVPVTALASCSALIVAGEGPFLRFYHARNLRYISSIRIFKAQAVHGITVYPESYHHTIKLLIWGGRLVRAIEIDPDAPHIDENALTICSSTVATLPDWILDLAPRPKSLDDSTQHQKSVCVAVTAHNALVQVTIERQNGDAPSDKNSSITIAISELTSSSRSILYSAHLFWESLDRVLVAAGTAFGEIIYWSWSDELPLAPASRIHRVFTGHEGSIFGVQISQKLPSECCQQLRRVIASCSDDRTIRIWDVSEVDTDSTTSAAQDNNLEVLRTRHTGFNNEAFDSGEFNSSNCLAIGFGHMSRVWTVRFMDASPCSGSLLLQSAGEDATARTWELTMNTGKPGILPYKLQQLDCAAHHSGKSMWSSIVWQRSTGVQHVMCGAADSKITTTPLLRVAQAKRNTSNATTEYTVQDVLSWAHPPSTDSRTGPLQDSHGLGKQIEFFRSYCFIDDTTFLLTTNRGKVLTGSLRPDSIFNQSGHLSGSAFVDQPDDLNGYSVCISGALPGVAFIAAANGSLYIYLKRANKLGKVRSMSGKVGDMFSTVASTSRGQTTLALLVALVGQKEAQLLYIDAKHALAVVRTVNVPVSGPLTGSLLTSMVHVRGSGQNFVIIGFRRGSIAVFEIPNDEPETAQASLLKVIERAHGDETVTALQWAASAPGSLLGHLLSVGRDGRLAIHYMDLSSNYVEMAHNLTLPFGPNVEGLSFQDNRLLAHGFSSKRWFLYDLSNEEEVMSVETGGAHRSWAFRPDLSSTGGTLVWTRASSMQICSQKGPNHSVIRPGGHGREIKAVAVSPRTSKSRGSLIATGAEDTDIKILQYVNGDLICRRTLRKHTTGIQHLQWSKDGNYLFSSGGCEEFYIWRIRELPSFLDIGVVCEYLYLPESEHADLRIMSFDVTAHTSGYTIAMVFSDSSVKVYRYEPTATLRWLPVARGTYFTSCLTQSTFLSPEKLLIAGTDGHAVTWSLPPDTSQSIDPSCSSAVTLHWQHPTRIHQNSSKVMLSHIIDSHTTLIVSGGDDGSLAFLLARPTASEASTSVDTSYASPPILVTRAHASAVTACAVISWRSHIYLLTSGNDEWLRLWEISIRGGQEDTNNASVTGKEDPISIARLRKIKTNVADVSSMAVLENDDTNTDAKVLVCGVGMEVIRVEWGI